MRKGLLMDKLTDIETKNKEVKEKKMREKVVIVKDIKPLMDDLEDIEKEIKQKDALEKNWESIETKKDVEAHVKTKTEKGSIHGRYRFSQSSGCSSRICKESNQNCDLTSSKHGRNGIV